MDAYCPAGGVGTYECAMMATGAWRQAASPPLTPHVMPSAVDVLRDWLQMYVEMEVTRKATHALALSLSLSVTPPGGSILGSRTPLSASASTASAPLSRPCSSARVDGRPGADDHEARRVHDSVRRV